MQLQCVISTKVTLLGIYDSFHFFFCLYLQPSLNHEHHEELFQCNLETYF